MGSLSDFSAERDYSEVYKTQ